MKIVRIIKNIVDELEYEYKRKGLYLLMDFDKYMLKKETEAYGLWAMKTNKSVVEIFKPNSLLLQALNSEEYKGIKYVEGSLTETTKDKIRIAVNRFYPLDTVDSLKVNYDEAIYMHTLIAGFKIGGVI